MKKKICSPLQYCMYCGKSGPESFTDEHVIAECMGGELIIPNSTCSACSAITSKIELLIARGALYEARAKFNTQSKRRKNYPKTLPVKLMIGKYGPEKVVEVPINEAPIFVIIPHYSCFRTENENLYSICQLTATAMDEDDNRESFTKLFAKYNVHSAEAVTRSIEAEVFVRMLWKSAYGFFWITDQESVKGSKIAQYILGGLRPFHSEASKNGKLLAINLTSQNRTRSNDFKASARIYSMGQEGDKFIYCELDFMSPFGLPKYTCRIKNLSLTSIDEVLYSVF